MATVTVTLSRNFATVAARALGNAAHDASRRAGELGVYGTPLGISLAHEAATLRVLHSDMVRALAGCPSFDADGNPMPFADCDPVTGQEYGTGA